MVNGQIYLARDEGCYEGWNLVPCSNIDEALAKVKAEQWPEDWIILKKLPVEDAMDFCDLVAMNLRLRDAAQGYLNGQLEMQKACDTLFDANMKHGAWRKEAEAKIEDLQAENARLRKLLDKALEEHIENSLTVCPDDCWCREAEAILEGTK